MRQPRAPLSQTLRSSRSPNASRVTRYVPYISSPRRNAFRQDSAFHHGQVRPPRLHRKIDPEFTQPRFQDIHQAQRPVFGANVPPSPPMNGPHSLSVMSSLSSPHLSIHQPGNNVDPSLLAHVPHPSSFPPSLNNIQASPPWFIVLPPPPPIPSYPHVAYEPCMMAMPHRLRGSHPPPLHEHSHLSVTSTLASQGPTNTNLFNNSGFDFHPYPRNPSYPPLRSHNGGPVPVPPHERYHHQANSVGHKNTAPRLKRPDPLVPPGLGISLPPPPFRSTPFTKSAQVATSSSSSKEYPPILRIDPHISTIPCGLPLCSGRFRSSREGLWAHIFAKHKDDYNDDHKRRSRTGCEWAGCGALVGKGVGEWLEHVLNAHAHGDVDMDIVAN